MFIDFLLDVFEANRDNEALVWQGQVTTYVRLLELIDASRAQLAAGGIEPGMVVLLDADFSPVGVAMLLALVERGCIIVPITQTASPKEAQYRQIAEVEAVVRVDAADRVSTEVTGVEAQHELLRQLKDWAHPGLILFSSGATGEPKAVVHDFTRLLERYKQQRHQLRTLNFLLFDHIAGLNTLFYAIANASCVVTVQDRSPDAVCAAIEKYRVQLLPTSPTFLNLLLLSEAYKRHDLSSLELVTYGTEVMPESTLARFRALFPDVNVLQQYGTSETGVPRTKSRSADSVWVKMGGHGFGVRVVDGLLELKSPYAMLGYLNAPSPFTEDGWFMTGDAVEVDGEYMRILGRTSDMINVGGEKVYPAEVESVLLLMDGVEDATVTGERNPITGRIVKATVRLSTGESTGEFRRRMREFCKDKLQPYQIPQKIEIVDAEMYSERFKKLRRLVGEQEESEEA